MADMGVRQYLYVAPNDNVTVQQRIQGSVTSYKTKYVWSFDTVLNGDVRGDSVLAV